MEKNGKISEAEVNRFIAIISIALFSFIFLGAEYIFDNMMAYVTDPKSVVLAQSYILGISVIGFLIFPVINRFAGNYAKRILLLAGTITGIICIFVILQHDTYANILVCGLILFSFLGIAGSHTHYVVFLVMDNNRHLAKCMGTAYAFGILLQFANNNFVKNDMAQSIVLSVFLMVLLILIMRLEDVAAPSAKESIKENKEKGRTLKNPAVAAASMVISVILMTCVFSTLDNAVTLVHAAGSVDIGRWSRLFLALSGLIAGFLYDIKGRRYMNIMMYCVTLLSTICVVIIQMGGPFMAGLVVFYLSAGFFVVFFTTGFMDLAYYMKLPQLWAGLGRAVNNISAVLIGSLSVSLLSSGNEMAIIVTALVLFALISISAFIYSNQFIYNENSGDKEIRKDSEKFAEFSVAFSLTDREQEVLKVLLMSDDNVQDIAEKLLISRAALYRHITNLNEKTGTKSRIGLMQLYYSWKK